MASTKIQSNLEPKSEVQSHFEISAKTKKDNCEFKNNKFAKDDFQVIFVTKYRHIFLCGTRLAINAKPIQTAMTGAQEKVVVSKLLRLSAPSQNGTKSIIMQKWKKGSGVCDFSQSF